MTVYYVNPATGLDSNTGLSWAQAWRTLWGLQAASVVPGPGDEIRIAKTPTFTPTLGTITTVAGTTYASWYKRGVLGFSSDDMTLGRQTMRNLGSFSGGGGDSQPRRPYVYLTGTLTPDVPGTASDNNTHYPEIHATAYAGEYNAQNVELFGGGYYSMSVPSGVTRHRMSGAIRCHVPYTGPGDDDLPAGALELRLYDGTTLLEVCPLPAIRNSDTEWTAFSYDFPVPWSADKYISTLNIWVARTGVPLTRDSSPFGVELSPICFARQGGLPPFSTCMELTRQSSWSGNTGEVVGTGMRVFAERIAEDDLWCPELISVSAEATSRVSSTFAAFYEGYPVPELSRTGALPQSPPGAKGIFNLNGSAGGTAGSPLVIVGGWNTATDTVDGVTVYTAGLSHRLVSSFVWIDLHGSNHVRVENVVLCHGFASLFSRAGTVHLKACGLPYAPTQPAFGEVTTATNVTLENMFVAPTMLEGFGVIGDLTLLNTYYASQRNPQYAEARNEVGTLTITDSFMGVGHTFYGPARPTYVRGDATLTQCTLYMPPQLVSVAFGHTLRFVNHKPAASSMNVTLIPTSPESVWDHIEYVDVSMPTYQFGSSLTVAPSADALITLATALILGPNCFATSLRGTPNTHAYTDGVNLFMSTAQIASREDEDRGHAYVHAATQRPAYSSWDWLDAVSQLGDASVPPWTYQKDMIAGTPAAVVDSPEFAVTGRVALSKRVSNITYRTDASLFVVSGRPTTAPGWVTVQAVFVPKAGHYRAHFGFMKENLTLQHVSSNYIEAPLTEFQPSVPISSGALLGHLGVFANYLVGSPKVVPYYASTAAEAAAGQGNVNLDEWVDFYIDFEVSAACLVEMRHGTKEFHSFSPTIFDILDVYATD